MPETVQAGKCQGQFILTIGANNYLGLLVSDVDMDLQVFKLPGADVTIPCWWSDRRAGPECEIFREVLRKLTILAGNALIDVVPVIVGVEYSLFCKGTQEDGQGKLVEVSDCLLGLLIAALYVMAFGARSFCCTSTRSSTAL